MKGESHDVQVSGYVSDCGCVEWKCDGYVIEYVSVKSVVVSERSVNCRSLDQLDLKSAYWRA